MNSSVKFRRAELVNILINFLLSRCLSLSMFYNTVKNKEFKFTLIIVVCVELLDEATRRQCLHFKILVLSCLKENSTTLSPKLLNFHSDLATSLSWTCTSKQGLTCYNALLFWAVTGSCHITPTTGQYTSLVLKGNPAPNGAEWDGERGGRVTLNRKDTGWVGVVFQGPSVIYTGTL